MLRGDTGSSNIGLYLGSVVRDFICIVISFIALHIVQEDLKAITCSNLNSVRTPQFYLHHYE